MRGSLFLKFLGLVWWGGREKVWNLVRVFILFFKKLVWDGRKWEPCCFSFSFLSFGLKGGLAERKVE